MKKHENCFHLVALLKACAKNKDLHIGEKLHVDIAKCGLINKSPYLANALINMYSKCGSFNKARLLLEEIPIQSVVSWNALIAGYAQQGLWHETIYCFEQMENEGLYLNPVTFICSLKGCGSNIGDISKGKKIHEMVVIRGLLEKDMVLGNALVDMYAKCGALSQAEEALEELPDRNVVSWSAVMGGYVQQGQGLKALDCFERMKSEGISPNAISYICVLKACAIIRDVNKGKQIHDEILSKGMLSEKNIVLGTALVDMYAKCGLLAKAQLVLEELPARNVVSWSALIVGYAQQGHGHKALNCFTRMQSEGLLPDAVTFICILRACSTMGDIERGEKIHEEIANRGLLRKNIVLGNSLIDMYVKCGMLAKAEAVLKELTIRDVVSWSSLIDGYAQQGRCHAALSCFRQMQSEGFSPNAVTFICILKACGSTGAIAKGKEIHDEIVNRGFLLKDITLGTSLVDMYAKCGALGKAQQVLEELPVRDVVAWNAMISGYAQQKQGEIALSCFQWMQNEAICPDKITFLSILSACNHMARSDVAETLFGYMSMGYGLVPDLEHHTCMVVAFGCSGHFDKAISVINAMPCAQFAAVWIALLGGCRKWGNVELARVAFDQALQLEYNCGAAYVLMANIFAAAGMHDDKEKVEAMRLKYGVGN